MQIANTCPIAIKQEDNNEIEYHTVKSKPKYGIKFIRRVQQSSININYIEEWPLLLFNAKYRRKCFAVLVMILLFRCMSLPSRVTAYNCTLEGNQCQNEGRCDKYTNQCICAEGWQGPECQFCGGKVRLHQSSGIIHDGWGNYSFSVKCSWLIDARHQSIYQNDINKPPTIRLHIKEFATECGWDHLYIYDGDSVDSPLLAVFSGLMYRGNISIRNVPQIIARSGTALLHFFSDDAYNMSGFNLSYRINGCPSHTEELDCSGHGKCEDGFCICDPLYSGEACNIADCPKDCFDALDHGHCSRGEGKCICRELYGGDDCNQIKANGVWSSVYSKQSLPPAGSASHGAAVWHDTLYLIGGESYGYGEMMTTYDFNGNVWQTVHPENTANEPLPRYGMSTVMYGDKIFMYGGVIKSYGITNELWSYDVSSRLWENITGKHDTCNAPATSLYTMCGPLQVTGHTATAVPGYLNFLKYPSMVVIFGHSPQYGYLNTVQEFNFVTRKWKILQTHGYVVKGGFGHSAAYDPLTEQIYVYGGITSETESSQVLSSKLYSYQHKFHKWSLLTAAPSARLLHTANFISPGLMMVFGGNTHNDTSQSYGAKCYSYDLLVYDVLCDSWHTKDIPDDLQADLSRFGHSAVVFEDDLYIYGGFNGQMLNDMLRFTPGICSYHTNPEKCINARPGVKCIWDLTKNLCIPVRNEQRTALLDHEQYDYNLCPSKSRLAMTSELLNYVTHCNEMKDCESCVSNSFGCTYCIYGNCSKIPCRELSTASPTMQVSTTQETPVVDLSNYSALRDRSPVNIKSIEYCPRSSFARDAAFCEQLHTCHACAADAECTWYPEQNRCMLSAASDQRTTEERICPPACASFTTCHNCTEDDCIWCQNEQRCVDRNAYTASFPYGQCREWTAHASKCRTPSKHSTNTSIGGYSAQCDFYNSCLQCLDDPACGWCDDGSHTGVGRCTEGGALKPYNTSECPFHLWHFTSCPQCNCNGHSECPDKINCIQPCLNLTVGAHCEKCSPGYYGNPINGGQCRKCECNNQGDSCHPETGKCYCSTKGIVGDHCEKCDTQNQYNGDPLTSSCYYELAVDYQFTFNLSKKEDRHFRQINFRNSPTKPEIDADFTITCSVPAKVNISLKEIYSTTFLFSSINCSTFRYRFSKTKYKFGNSSKMNVSLSTFYVNVYDFQPPIWIQIAFSQYPKLNLQQFFITFSTCFLLLLLMAAILWKIKQKYDMFRRRQRLFVEMEQMASRPFSQVLVEIEHREHIDLTQTIEGVTILNKKRIKDIPSPVALEPCSGNRAAVLSLLVRLPTGGLQQAPAGQSAGLAVASALVTLGNPRRPSIEHSKEPKSKRKQSQHPDSCT